MFSECSIVTSSGEVVPTLSCIFPLIATIINWLLMFSGLVTVVLIIYAGIRFVSSGGDPKQVEGAKKILTYAILGLILIFLSFAIVRFIAQVTGVACISPRSVISFTSCGGGGGGWGGR